MVRYGHIHNCGRCANGMMERRRPVLIILKREELIYDIQNICYVEGDIKQVNDEHERHQIMDVAEDGNIDRVLRVLERVHTETLEMLYTYSKDRCTSDFFIDKLVEPDDYGYMLMVPESISMTTMRYLETNLHEYMVDMAIADWLSITKPEASDNWTQKARAAKSAIRSCMAKKAGPVLRPLRPF